MPETHHACHTLNDIVFLYLANAVLCLGTASHLECDFGGFLVQEGSNSAEKFLCLHWS